MPNQLSRRAVMHAVAITGLSCVSLSGSSALETQDDWTLVPATDAAWTYWSGNWNNLSDDDPSWGGGRMVGQVNPHSEPWQMACGRRASIVVEAPRAELHLARIRSEYPISLSVSLDGGSPTYYGPDAPLNAWGNLVLFSGAGNPTQVDIIYDEYPVNVGLYIPAGNAVRAVSEIGPCPSSCCQKQFVAFGHSFVVGAAAVAPGANGFVSLLGDRLCSIAINQGVSGTDVDTYGTEAWPGAEGVLRVHSDLVGLNPHFVLLMYGINAACDDDCTQYGVKYTEMLDALRSKVGSPCPIFCVTVPSTRYTTPAGLDTTNFQIRRAVAGTAECHLIEAQDWWSSEAQRAEYLSDDGVHPNNAGHRYMADRCLEVMTPVLAGMG